MSKALPPYSPHDMVAAHLVPEGLDPVLKHIPDLPALPPPPMLEALRAAPSSPPVPQTLPAPDCRNCRWNITTSGLAGECRKVAITTTSWGAFAGMPGNHAAQRFQARADAEASAAAAYRSGDTPTCAARTPRVGVAR